MPTRLVHLAVDSADPARIGQFWAAALGWVVAAEDEDEVVVWPADLGYPDPAVLPLVFVPVPEPKTGKNRLHLDLASSSAEHQAAVVDRLRELGATPIDVGQGEVPWVVLADPEGNELCVLEPRPVYDGIGPIAAVVVDSSDPVAQARFWAEVAGWQPHQTEADFASLRSPAGAGPYLEFLSVPDPNPAKNRVHLDVAAYPTNNRAAELQRVRDLGAVPADVGQGEVSWTVLADPEGNEFCILSNR